MTYRDKFKADYKGISDIAIERSILRAWKPEWSVEKPYGHDFTHHFLAYLALFAPHIDQHDFTVKQARAFEDCVFIKRRKILNIIGGKNSGKTNFMATFALAMVSIWPEYTTVYVAAPYMSAAESTVWGEILVGAEKVKQANKELWKGLKVARSRNRVIFRDLPKTGFIELRTLDKVGKLQGTKSLDPGKGWLLLLCDEIALFPTRDLLDLLDNLTGNDNFCCIDGCNFKNTHGLEGELCKPQGREYEALNIDEDHEWDSDYMSYTLRLDGHKSPNVVAGEVKYRYLLRQSQIDDAMVIHGAQGPKYLEQIRSFPNSSMSDYFVTSREKIRAGGGYDDFVFDKGDEVRVAACDPGFGGDPCRIGVFEFCNARMEDSGGRFHTVPIFMPLAPMQTLELISGAIVDKEWIDRLHAQSNGEMFMEEGRILTLEKQIVIQTGEFLRKWGVDRRNFVFDGSLRAEIVQEYVAILGNQVRGLDYGGYATDRETGLTSGKSARDLYGNFITEMYFNFAMLVQSGQFRGANLVPGAVKQVCGRMWKSGKKDVKHLESKGDYKKTHQGQSPDDSDVMVMALEAALRAGFMRTQRGRPGGVGSVGKIIAMINNSGRFRQKTAKSLNR